VKRKPRFKIGDIITGQICVGDPDITALILAHSEAVFDFSYGKQEASYKVLIEEKVMNLNALYADQNFEKLNDT